VRPNTRFAAPLSQLRDVVAARDASSIYWPMTRALCGVVHTFDIASRNCHAYVGHGLPSLHWAAIVPLWFAIAAVAPACAMLAPACFADNLPSATFCAGLCCLLLVHHHRVAAAFTTFLVPLLRDSASPLLSSPPHSRPVCQLPHVDCVRHGQR
jgi:hypothetical protein